MALNDVRQLMQVLGNLNTAETQVMVLIKQHPAIQNHLNEHLKQAGQEPVDFETEANLSEALQKRNMTNEKLLEIIQSLSVQNLNILESAETTAYQMHKRKAINQDFNPDLGINKLVQRQYVDPN